MIPVNYIFANTGQTVRLVVQTTDGYGYPKDLDGYGNWLDGYGYLLQDGYYSNPPDGYIDFSDGYADGYYVPVVDNVRFPDLSLSPDFPIPMKRLSTGLYVQGIQLPNGTPAVGSYIIQISRMEFGQFILETYVVNAARPFGVSSVSPV